MDQKFKIYNCQLLIGVKKWLWEIPPNSRNFGNLKIDGQHDMP